MNQAHIIAVSSGKGGVGKSNVSTNIAIQLSKQGHRVCIFDADINLSNIPILLGLTPKYTLADLFDSHPLEEIILPGPEGIDIVAGGSGVTQFIKYSSKQQNIILDSVKQLTSQYDYIILDTAAGVDNQVLSFLHCAPYLILILTPEPTSITDAYALLKILNKQHYEHKILVMVNQVTDLQMAKNIFNRFNEAVEKYLKFKVSFIGYLVSDMFIQQSVLAQQAFSLKYPDSPAGQCMMRISQRLDQALTKLNNKTDAFVDYFQNIIEARPLYESELSRVNDIMELISLLSEQEQKDLFVCLGSQYQQKPPLAKTENSKVEQEKLLPALDKQHLLSALSIAAKI